VVVGEDTLLIEREDSWDIEFSVNDTVSKNLLHHFLLTGLSVSTTNEVTLLNSTYWFALRVLSTLLSFSLTEVWGTSLINQMSVFSQISMEERPSTITALIHIIACHKILRREDWDILAILSLKS
jgi:hypothetical protein